MKLIKEVKVERFRSIREATLRELGHFSGLAGLNNAGKSNFLRALNVFFTEEVEPSVPFKIDREYYRPDLTSKKKKQVRISVAFELPKIFKFRKGLEFSKQLLGDNFILTKEWTRDRPQPNIYLNEDTEPLASDEEQAVYNFFNLINFRYIPNRVIPTDVILREHKNLRDVLIRRLGKYGKQSDNVFSGINQTAQALIKDLNEEIIGISPDISEVRLAIPKSLADLIFNFGYFLKEGNSEMGEDEQGSGIQSLLMFQTLNLIDRDYYQRFGWKQASIWTIEEPESSLHTSLEAQVAFFLSKISYDEISRLQTLATTHSDLVIQYSDQGYFINKEKHSSQHSHLSSVAEKCESVELLKKSAKYGITRWVNPLLLNPLRPLVLFDGKFDVDFIKEALRVLGRNPEYIPIYLEDITGVPGDGGADRIKSFIKQNVDAIRTRSSSSPVIIILDWEDSSKVNTFEGLLESSDPYGVLVWPGDQGNPKLKANSFKGIERFFSDRIFAEAEKRNGNLIGTTTDQQKMVSPENRDELKKLLNQIVLEGLEEDDLIHSEAFIRLIDEKVEFVRTQNN